MRDFFLSLDPAIVLERKQVPTPCQGCKHRFVVWGVPVCLITEGKAGAKMERCEKFDSKQEKRRY